MSKIKVTNEGKEISNGSVRIVLDERLDIFAGGTPCQDVSVAGKRNGMQEGSGTRSSLAFEFVRLVRELKPRIVLWENVAGVLSDKSFPEFLTALANCWYGVAYRAVCYDGYNQAGKEECCHTLRACNSESPNNDNVVKVAIKQSFGINPFASGMMIDHTPAVETGLTLRKSPGGENGVIIISQMKYIVRRLTPIECERLTGLPDGWTIPKNLVITDALVAEFQRVHDTYGAIMYEYAIASYERSHREGEPPPNPPKPKFAAWVRKWIEKIANPDTCPDSPRYKVDGNGWATNQPRWILTRLLAVEGVDWSLHH